MIFSYLVSFNSQCSFAYDAFTSQKIDALLCLREDEKFFYMLYVVEEEGELIERARNCSCFIN